MKAVAKKAWDYIEGINGLLLILYCIFVFSTAVICSENFTKSFFLTFFIFITVICVIICPMILRVLSKLEIKSPYIPAKQSVLSKLLFYIIPFALFLLYYIAYYPGGFSNDSISQFGQTINGKYSDWHPVIQTLFAFKLPLALTGGWVGSITLFQIICFSAVLGYSFNALYKYTHPAYAVVSMLFVLLNPQLTTNSMYPWKDVSFAIGALLLLAYALQIYFSNGTWLESKLNTGLFIITAVLTTLFRHNALLFTVPLIIAVLLCTTKKRGLVVALSIIVLYIGVKVPLYSALNVEQPGERQVETLGVPMTVIGAVVTNDPDIRDEEILEFAYKVAPKEVWEQHYNYSFNSVKWKDGTDTMVIEEYGAQRVIPMMLRCFKNAPVISSKALIKLTRAAYTLSDNYTFVYYPGISQNSFDIAQSGNNSISTLLKSYCSFASKTFPHLFMYLGSMHLLLIASVLAKCKLNCLKDWKKILFIIPVFAYNYGTTLLLSGVSDSIRFFFYTFTLVPLFLVFLYKKDDEGSSDENVLISK